MSRTFGCSESEALDILGLWDLPEGMVLESAELAKTATRSDVRDVDGTLLTNSGLVHGFRDEMSATFRASSRNPDIANYDGSDANGWCIDEVTVSTAKGQKARLALRAHAHRKTAAGTIQIHQEAARVGASDIPRFGGFGASAFGFSLGVAAASLQSGSYTVRFLHKDADDEEGNWLCGKTYGAVAAAKFEAIDDTDWIVPSGWTRVRAGEAERNAAFGRRTLSIEKTLW